MQGPPVNLVLLGFLILFFGLQLRRRNVQPYSGWLLGWIFVFLSYLIWDMVPFAPTQTLLLEILRIDLQTLGIVSFLLSFVLREASMRRTLVLAFCGLGPTLLMFDLQAYYPTHGRIYGSLALVSFFVKLIAIYTLVPREWIGRRVLLYGLAAVSFIAVLIALYTDPLRFLMDAILVPLLIGVVVLYMASSKSRPTVRGLGAIGFLLWAGFYVFGDVLLSRPAALHVLYQYWDLPKYFAGMAMILELFEVSRLDVEQLAERYRLLYENLDMLYEDHPHPMWIYDARSKKILSANAAAAKNYGYSFEQMRGMSIAALELPQDSSVPGLADSGLLDAAPLSPGSRRALHRRSTGEIAQVVVTEHDLLYEGKDAIVVLAVDVTEQEKLHKELFHRAHHDPLTQLPNRGLLADRVAQVLARSERDAKCAVLLTIDIDHFKQINDTYGHPVGDECLKIVASRLQSRIRSVDTLARTGGEEFTAIIGGLTRCQDAIIVAETLRGLFDPPLILENQILHITISIGGAVFPDDGTTLETLVKRSDDALYSAKRAGRNRCMFAASVMQ